MDSLGWTHETLFCEASIVVLLCFNSFRFIKADVFVFFQLINRALHQWAIFLLLLLNELLIIVVFILIRFNQSFDFSDSNNHPIRIELLKNLWLFALILFSWFLISIFFFPNYRRVLVYLLIFSDNIGCLFIDKDLILPLLFFYDFWCSKYLFF